jgi:cytosine/adenosine deaminase-related metal-dependent hydrolase
VTVPNRPIGALVFSAHGTDVDTVVINGEFRLRDGELVGFNGEQEVLEEATVRAREAIERAGLTDRIFVDWRK